MRTVTAMDLRARLGQILDAASGGERIVIERDHKPMALLVPYEDRARLDPDQQERTRRFARKGLGVLDAVHCGIRVG